jgi:two-component system, OmpR family, sensor histidine kinase KdpD
MSTTDDTRPSPEHFLALIEQQKRGRLKIYLGFAAGVGKTFEMLQEGNRLRRQGVDAVVGIVETHGRPETAAQIGELEQVPRRRIEYRGVVLEEMDTDAILARRPTVCLVDELAHTNAPGSRNAKRYEDVRELLRAGINVISTLNVQHVESLYDTVERFTHVKVKERIPDSVVAEADQVVNVDLSAEDLQERLRKGLVYPPERAERALANFFTDENLSQLRELAVEHIAHHLDRRRQGRGAGRPAGSERVMVCLSSRSPIAARLLRSGARLADRLGAPWYAVYVQTPGERMEKVDAATQRQIDDTLTLAHQLGGIPMKYSGADVASAVAEFSREYNITHIVIGRTRQPWYRRLLGRSILERLLEAAPDVNVLVLGTT